MKRPLLAAAVAPAAPVAMIALVSVLGGDLSGIFWWSSIVLPISYALSIAIGGPIHLALRKLKLVSVWAYGFFGLLASQVPITFLIAEHYSGAGISSQSLRDFIPLTSMMGVAGILVAAVFWCLARPDAR